MEIHKKKILYDERFDLFVSFLEFLFIFSIERWNIIFSTVVRHKMHHSVSGKQHKREALSRQQEFL